MPAAKDYTGIKYGKLTAVRFLRSLGNGKRIWLFQCECGEMVERRHNSVSTSANAGCMPACPQCVSLRHQEVGRKIALEIHRRDYTGQVFGKLTALEPAGYSRNGIVWRFQCECGTIIERPAIRVAAVTRRKKLNGEPVVPSCGGRQCLSRFLLGNQAAFNRVFENYRRDAVRRCLPFELTKDFVRELISQPCRYCGQPPAQLAMPSRNRQASQEDILVRNGIDRINSTIGYVAENVVACCKQCN